MGIETIIDKESAKLAGKLLVPVYAGVVAYNEMLKDTPHSKYVKVAASTFLAVATLNLEVQLIYFFYRAFS